MARDHRQRDPATARAVLAAGEKRPGCYAPPASQQSAAAAPFPRRPHMDAKRFDRLARILSTTPTRRLLLTALSRGAAGTAVAALIAVGKGERAAAGGCKRIGSRCGRA